MGKLKDLETEMRSMMAQMAEHAKGNPLLEKKMAIAQNIIGMADDMVQIALLTHKKKRIFQPKNRLPKFKRERRRKIFEKMVSLRMRQHRHFLIMSQQIPKTPFPDGGVSRGLGIVGETGQEIVVSSSGKLILPPNK